MHSRAKRQPDTGRSGEGERAPAEARLPAADPAMVAAAPSPADPEYAEKALAFVQANAPDVWEGMGTNFFSTFNNTVTYEEAFPGGNVDPERLLGVFAERLRFAVDPEALVQAAADASTRTEPFHARLTAFIEARRELLPPRDVTRVPTAYLADAPLGVGH